LPSCGTAVAVAVTAEERMNTKYVLIPFPPSQSKEKATPLRSPGHPMGRLAERLVLFTFSVQSLPRRALYTLKEKRGVVAVQQCSAHLTTYLEIMAHSMGCSFYPAPVLNLYPYIVLVTLVLIRLTRRPKPNN